MYHIKMEETPEKGHSMVATKAFDVGEIILEEEAFVSCQLSWTAPFGSAACDYCMRPLETVTENLQRLTRRPYLVVPHLQCDPTIQRMHRFSCCSNCKVWYCSEYCRLKAFNKYHRTSCLGMHTNDATHSIKRLNELLSITSHRYETGTLMIFKRLMAMYQQSTNKDYFFCTLQNLQSLVASTDQQIYYDMFGFEFHAAFCTAFDDEDFELFRKPEVLKMLVGFIGCNRLRIKTSVFAEWSERAKSLDMPNDEKVILEKFIDEMYSKVGNFIYNESSGIYLMQSRINHSCIPNAQVTFPYSNNIAVLKAIRPIQSGEEVCISHFER